MNNLREQKPYVFCPPKFSRALHPLLCWVSRKKVLEKQYHVRGVTLKNGDPLKKLARDGHSILIAPNHADHADPQVLIRASEFTRTPFHFMAAREGFEKAALIRKALQAMGAFSVDREGNDLSAIRMAMKIIQEGTFPLVIFPEGEIWHHHEVLDELNEGVATIVLRAAGKVDENKKAYVIPTALHYSYDEAVRDTFVERLNALEHRIAWKPRPDLPVVDRIYRIGRGMVALKEVEHLGGSREGDLVERLRFLQNALVEQVEQKHDLSPETDHLPTRVKNLRQKIRKQLSDEKNEEETDSLYSDLDVLFTAIQVYSYPGHYLNAAPTTGRVAETLLKLEEDILGEGGYPAPRDATVQFGKPICIADFLTEHNHTTKTAVTPLTEEIGRQIQTMLNDLSASS
jgi:1-acyl-sn-glycerol-3-phosphate acyltransferase